VPRDAERVGLGEREHVRDDRLEVASAIDPLEEWLIDREVRCTERRPAPLRVGGRGLESDLQSRIADGVSGLPRAAVVERPVHVLDSVAGQPGRVRELDRDALEVGMHARAERGQDGNRWWPAVERGGACERADGRLGGVGQGRPAPRRARS